MGEANGLVVWFVDENEFIVCCLIFDLISSAFYLVVAPAGWVPVKATQYQKSFVLQLYDLQLQSTVWWTEAVDYCDFTCQRITRLVLSPSHLDICIELEGVLSDSNEFFFVAADSLLS